MAVVNDIVLLGSTGSIGVQTLDVARMHNIKVKALAANSSVTLLEKQAREFMPEKVCVFRNDMYNSMKLRLADTDMKGVTGMEGLCELASMSTSRVVNSVVGMVGLKPTLAAIESGNDLALANKETLVTGGALVTKAARDRGVSIIPVDSEHSAIFQCLMGNTENKPERILLTASGGPFFGWTTERLKNVTKEQALRHPNWTMGAKITIDSATLMNKGLEFIEAMWLFDVRPEQIQILVHRQSIVHSAVEFADGAVMAQLGVPDMRIPIQLALTYPSRLPSPSERLSLFDKAMLTFEEPDEESFTCLKYAKRAAMLGGTSATVVNAANEAAVSLFLNNKISFYRIFELVALAAENVPAAREVTLSAILETEEVSREFVRMKA